MALIFIFSNILLIFMSELPALVDYSEEPVFNAN